MDYNKLTESLRNIKEVCEKVTECDECPFGNSDGDCMIQSENPSDWIMVDTQVVRLMK